MRQKARTFRATPLLLVLVAIIANIVVAARPAAADSCTVADPLTLTLGNAGSYGLYIDVGGVITLSAGASTIPCGSATAQNTNAIEVVGTDAAETFVLNDGRSFSPGAEDEPSGKSEIEIDIDLGNGDDILVFYGTAKRDRYAFGREGLFGQTKANLNDDNDADVSIAGVTEIVVQGSGGRDTIKGSGGKALPYPSTLPLGVDAGPGADRITGTPANDEVFGGEGGDVITGRAGSDVLNGDQGADRIIAGDGESDDVDCGGSQSDEAKIDKGLDTHDGCESVTKV